MTDRVDGDSLAPHTQHGDTLADHAVESQTVPPPVQHEIDALVDAVSAGGRPRRSSDRDAIADPSVDVLAGSFPPETNDETARRSPRPRRTISRPQTSIITADALRYVGGTIAAFALGALVTRGVLRSLDPPTTVALNQPPAPAPNPVVPIPLPPPAPREPSAAAPVPTAPPPVAVPVLPPTPRATPLTATRGKTPSVAVPATTSLVIPDARENAPPVSPAETRAESAPPPVVPAPSMPPPVTVAPPAVPPAPAVAVAPAPGPAPRPSAATAAPPSALAIDRGAVIATVQEYTQAYRAMDVAAAAAVWPSVDRRALERAFATLKSQALELGECEVKISNASATVRCRGTVEYVRKIGDATPRTGRQDWLFKMRKLGDEWIIDALDATPVASVSPDAKRGA